MNVAGNSPPSNPAFVTLAPDAPSGFEVEYTLGALDTSNGRLSGGRAKLVWTAANDASVNDPSIQRYEYRKNATSTWKRIPCSGTCDPLKQSHYTVNLAQGTTYDFELRAVSIAGPGYAATDPEVLIVGTEQEAAARRAAPDAARPAL